MVKLTWRVATDKVHEVVAELGMLGRETIRVDGTIVSDKVYLGLRSEHATRIGDAPAVVVVRTRWNGMGGSLQVKGRDLPPDKAEGLGALPGRSGAIALLTLGAVLVALLAVPLVGRLVG